MRSRTPDIEDRMLEVAARLFGRLRFHEVRMEDIAAEAGVGKGTLYRYFEDKEELFLALLRRAAVQLHDELDRALAPVEAAVPRLEALVGTVLNFFDERPHLFDLLQRAEVMRGDDYPWRTTRAEMLRLVQRLFADARDRGECAVGDPELATLMLLGGLRSVIRFGRQPRPRGLARRIVAHVLAGAACDGAPSEPRRKRPHPRASRAAV